LRKKPAQWGELEGTGAKFQGEVREKYKLASHDKEELMGI